MSYFKEVEKLKIIDTEGILQILISIQILISLNKGEEMLKSRAFPPAGISDDDLYNSIEKLEKLGLIERQKYKFTDISPYRLTDKGISIAKPLEEVYNNLKLEQQNLA